MLVVLYVISKSACSWESFLDQYQLIHSLVYLLKLYVLFVLQISCTGWGCGQTLWSH